MHYSKVTLQPFLGEHPEDLNKIKIHLDRFSSSGLSQNNDAQIDALEANFLKLTKNLEDPVERIQFFKAYFPVVYGCDFDRALQALVCQFLSRLENLLPVPDLKQVERKPRNILIFGVLSSWTASWLSAVPSASDECLQSVSHTEDLQYLLQHHTCCGKLDKLFPSPAEDCILASLSLPTTVGVAYGSDSKLDVLPNLEGSCKQRDGDFDWCWNQDHFLQTMTTQKRKTMNLLQGSLLGCLAALNHHLVTYHHPRRPFPKHCPLHGVFPTSAPSVEGVFIYPSQLVQHQRIHTGDRPYKCTQCGKTSSNSTGLSKHHQKHCLDATFVCPKCRESFRSLHETVQTPIYSQVPQMSVVWKELPDDF